MNGQQVQVHLYLASACLCHSISFLKKNTYAWLHMLAACYEASKKSRGTPNHMSLNSTATFKANSFQPRKKNCSDRDRDVSICYEK